MPCDVVRLSTLRAFSRRCMALSIHSSSAPHRDRANARALWRRLLVIVL
ncbi:MAG: hypothetical protein M0P38_01310 [Bacteroidales bacterium]|nr:hypothetical protein [Bacteroidales bacterium]